MTRLEVTSVGKIWVGVLSKTGIAAKSLQSCPTLWDPIDGSPPGSTVPGILQARTLEWVAISFSNAWKWRVKVKSLSRVWLLVTSWTAAYQAPPSMGFSGNSTGVGCHCLLFMIILNFWLFTHSVSTRKSFSSSFKKYILHLTTSHVCSVLPTVLSTSSFALYILFST